jgi:hypothetical protein
MNPQDSRGHMWLRLTVQVFSFLAMVISLGAAAAIYSTQAQDSTTTLWPLPGLVLLDWVLIGIIGFMSTYLVLRGVKGKWLRAAWIITGTFIPLIILGAFSIGFFVLIAFILYVISIIILTVQRKSQWLLSFGLLMLGSIINLVLLLIMITLGNPSLGL